MKEVKFRAWDTEREVMAKVSHIGLDDYEVSMQDEECTCWRAPYPYVCTLMQWTGMKDINGNEIYEGDIIKVHERMAGNDFVGKVIYDKSEGCYWLLEGGEKNHCKITFNLEDYSHEIIGNIFENEELLERQ